ncbi:twin-arginine translocation protein TatA [Bartonella bovis 91-4]|uniref:Twin-arginine translocation protein TatA n=1 Tax=Bartonella bovis 91-4 TaxID=1094491 RepID=N6VMB3_9HYPH|nr:twin-arginine translocation protein TatA [Bartonella bovis 91-4]
MIIILLIILVLFGHGKASELMDDVANSIKAFFKNMKEEEGSVENKLEVASYFTIIDVDFSTISIVISKMCSKCQKSSSSVKTEKKSVSKR